jgi:hypothetical protein
MARRPVGGCLDEGWEGEPPIRRDVRPDQCEGKSSHTQPRERIRRMAETIEGGEREGNSGIF